MPTADGDTIRYSSAACTCPCHDGIPPDLGYGCSCSDCPDPLRGRDHDLEVGAAESKLDSWLLVVVDDGS